MRIASIFAHRWLKWAFSYWYKYGTLSVHACLSTYIPFHSSFLMREFCPRSILMWESCPRSITFSTRKLKKKIWMLGDLNRLLQALCVNSWTHKPTWPQVYTKNDSAFFCRIKNSKIHVYLFLRHANVFALPAWRHACSLKKSTSWSFMTGILVYY